MIIMLTPELVRELLLATWGQQACQHPEYWPEVLTKLLKDGTCTNPGNTRASFAPRVDPAVTALTEAYDAGTPADGVDLVWRVFPMLDRPHCAELAGLLAAEAQFGPSVGPAAPRAAA
jgi:hypothetical protein